MLGADRLPPDPIAATAIAQRSRIPRRIVVILEGESLVNDATALVAYRFAVAAVGRAARSRSGRQGSRSCSTSPAASPSASASGWIVRQVRRRLDYPPAEVTISLLTGYFAYLPAELLGVSAVIAAVTAGIYLGWHTPELTNAEVRLLGESAWQIVTFVLNATPLHADRAAAAGDPRRARRLLAPASCSGGRVAVSADRACSSAALWVFPAA